jgi:hypothetical protein
MERQESEKSSLDDSTNSTTQSPVDSSDHQGLIPAQEMDFVCLGAHIQRSRDKADEDESYDYDWDEDGDLVFSKELKRGGRIDCWLGFEKEGAIIRLCYQSYLTEETAAGEPMAILGSWEWHKEMCKPPGGYTIVRNFWGETEGIPAIREAIEDGTFDNNDDGELDSNWAQLALAAFEDENE